MENSSYKVVLTSDATRGSTRYLQHYGVKGMKWGVVHDEDEKRRMAQEIALDKQRSPTGPYKSVLERDREQANKGRFGVERTHRTPYGDIVIRTQSSNAPDYKKIFNETVSKQDFKEGVKESTNKQDFEEGAREGVKEALKANQAQSVGDVIDKITSDEYREDVNYLQDIIIDELEERNPVAGKTLRAVDNFFDSVDSFISDFVKSANKIVGDIMSWGRKIFGG